MNTKTFILILTLGIFFGFLLTFFNKSEPAEESVENKIEVRAPTSDVSYEQVPADENQKYVNYSEENLQKAQIEGRTVLFFHAKWCPTCKAAEKDITENITELPEDITILKVDYDTETELKDKYAITYQHTFVQIDEEGNELAKWAGGELDSIIDNVQ